MENKFGGKGASLMLLDKYFNVPKFIIITYDFYERFIKYNNIENEINNTLNNLDINNLLGSSNKLKKLFINTDFSNIDKEKILNLTHSIKSKIISVRSSAIVEDSKKNSWAGQFDSYLNVNISEIYSRIIDVYSSLFNERALRYKINNNVANDSYKISVIIQKMINSTNSGVAFSEDTINNTDCILIESVYGTGDSLVSGIVTPDQYLVKNNIIIKKLNKENYIEKDSKIISYITCDNNKRLDDRNILRVAKTVNRIKKIYKTEIDVEFCFKGNTLYILQARPITVKTKCSNLNTIKEYLKTANLDIPYNNRHTLFSKMFFTISNNEYYNKDDIKYPDFNIQIVTDNNYLRIDSKVKNIVGKNKADIIKLINDDIDLSKRIINDINLNTHIFNENNYLKVKNHVKNVLKEYKNIFHNELYIRTIVNIYMNSNQDEDQDFNTLINNWRNSEEKDDAFLGMLFDTICFYGFKDYRELVFDYMSYYEFIGMLDNKYTVKNYVKKLIKRKKDGYAIINFPKLNIYCKFVTNSTYINNIKNIIIDRINNKDIFLKGESIIKSNSFVEGECILIKDERELIDKSLLENKIVVTPMTTPYFIPFLKDAKAIITDSGGSLCHASIIAKENGIPTVVGTYFATQKLKSKQIIKINLQSGEIEIIK